MEQFAHVLRDHYGLLLRSATYIDYGMWEESFRIETDQGRFFAKRFMRKERQSPAMLRGIFLSQQLREQGFPAPRVLPTRAGELLAEVDGERYQVTEWAEGRTYHPGELPPEACGPMGALLGRLHRVLGPGEVPPAEALPTPGEALRRCEALLERYAYRPEPFAAVAREVLESQIAVLCRLPAGMAAELPRPRLGGPVFNSFWVEQVLFRPDGSVSALIDWTDGAGKAGYWCDDLDIGIHLSALDLPAARTFMQGYLSENPLPADERAALVAELCYGHLASTNFLSGWFARPYRRMADWEATATLWHRQVVPRFLAWKEWESALVG